MWLRLRRLGDQLAEADVRGSVAHARHRRTGACAYEVVWEPEAVAAAITPPAGRQFSSSDKRPRSIPERARRRRSALVDARGRARRARDAHVDEWLRQAKERGGAQPPTLVPGHGRGRRR